MIQTLPTGEPVLGVTSLDGYLYVLLANRFSQQIEVYDVDACHLLGCLTVPGLDVARDIVACGHNRCVYISDSSQFHVSVHRLALPDATVTHWLVRDVPYGLSLTVTHGVLVTCKRVRKIKEFSTDGQLLHEVTLPEDVVSPWHSIQLSSGEFIVCHGDCDDPVRRVCLIGSDGSQVKSFGGPPGIYTGSQQMNVPVHMAVDRNGFVFVADTYNKRVLLLSPVLTGVRKIVSLEQVSWRPVRVHLDSDRRLLYVAENNFAEYAAGRVAVVSV